MGNQLEERVGQVENRQGQLDRRITNVEHHQQELRRLEAAIIVDNQKAHDYAMKYIGRFLAELTARSGMITSAMQRYNKFLELPPSSSIWGAVFDFAFGMLATAVPALRLAGVMRDAEVAIGIAEKAEVAAPKLAKTVHAVDKAVERGEVINKGRETVNKLREAHEKREKPEEAQKEATTLEKLDPHRQAFKELNEYAKKGVANWERVLDLLDAQLENRLMNLETPAKESMLVMAQRLLKLPEPFSQEELDQLELLYLWYLIGTYARQNVYVYRNTYYVEGAHNSWRREVKRGVSGLNDTQMDTIIDLFGPEARRGKYFTIFIWNIAGALGLWGVKYKETTG